METRTIIAYALIGVAVLAVAAGVYWLRKRRPAKPRSRDKWNSLLKD
jgi:LPXTG-motif cell wall-anchored protein